MRGNSMKNRIFPYIAVGLGLIAMLVVTRGNELRASGASEIPLLTLLVISEVAFFATAMGAFIGFKQLRAVGFNLRHTLVTAACVLLAGQFLWLGMSLWPR